MTFWDHLRTIIVFVCAIVFLKYVFALHWAFAIAGVILAGAFVAKIAEEIFAYMMKKVLDAQKKEQA